jgi:hypothetical protein
LSLRGAGLVIRIRDPKYSHLQRRILVYFSATLNHRLEGEGKYPTLGEFWGNREELAQYKRRRARLTKSVTMSQKAPLPADGRPIVANETILDSLDIWIRLCRLGFFPLVVTVDRVSCQLSEQL